MIKNAFDELITHSKKTHDFGFSFQLQVYLSKCDLFRIPSVKVLAETVSRKQSISAQKCLVNI